ncbi:MAG: hypothetical protein QXP03_05105 [Desulfurococcaceae archaeon]
MVKLITCKELVELLNVARNIGIEFREFLGVSLLLKEGYGRVAIAKRLKFRERLVRGVIEGLKKNGIEELVVRTIGMLSRALINAPWLGCKPVVYGNIDEELLGRVLTHIVSMRDYIVINSGNPDKVEVIGVLRSSVLEYPGLPQELLQPYVKVARLVGAANGILVCWKDYVDYFDDAVFLASLTNMCFKSTIQR